MLALKWSNLPIMRSYLRGIYAKNKFKSVLSVELSGLQTFFAKPTSRGISYKTFWLWQIISQCVFHVQLSLANFQHQTIISQRVCHFKLLPQMGTKILVRLHFSVRLACNYQEDMLRNKRTSLLFRCIIQRGNVLWYNPPPQQRLNSLRLL